MNKSTLAISYIVVLFPGYTALSSSLSYFLTHRELLKRQTGNYTVFKKKCFTVFKHHVSGIFKLTCIFKILTPYNFTTTQ